MTLIKLIKKYQVDIAYLLLVRVVHYVDMVKL